MPTFPLVLSRLSGPTKGTEARKLKLKTDEITSRPGKRHFWQRKHKVHAPLAPSSKKTKAPEIRPEVKEIAESSILTPGPTVLTIQQNGRGAIKVVPCLPKMRCTQIKKLRLVGDRTQGSAIVKPKRYVSGNDEATSPPCKTELVHPTDSANEKLRCMYQTSLSTLDQFRDGIDACLSAIEKSKLDLAAIGHSSRDSKEADSECDSASSSEEE